MSTDEEICAKAQETLDRVVDGITAFTMEFDGPSTAMIGSVPYVTLCSGGIKPQEELSPTFGGDDAIKLYGAALAEFIGDAQQVAWRCRPRFEIDDTDTTLGRFRVYSRLAFPA